MKTMFYHSRPFLIAELLAFTLALPVLLWLFLPARWILPVLWVIALVCHVGARRIDPSHRTGGWNWAAVTRANMVPILWRFALCAGLIFAATVIFKPEMLFGFIHEKPQLWAIVMVVYPLVSVITQEIVYRRYMFARFGGLLSPRWLIIMSGIAFGTAHVVFDNWVAPALCVIGGVIFSHTYHKTRSLWLVSIEHALYGNFLFTVGLGKYFYHGVVGAPH